MRGGGTPKGAKPASASMEYPSCRLCKSQLEDVLLDLGMTPLSNSLLANQNADVVPLYHLAAFVCRECFLVQTADPPSLDRIFDETYPYLSSISTTWLEHVNRFAERVIDDYALTYESQIVEIACNDGHLLRCFRERGLTRVLGIEPAARCAATAEGYGVATRREFFGSALAVRLVEEGLAADLLIANNVLAHVPDLHDFTEGLRIATKARGIITVEIPHVLQLLTKTLFDTIYHEHRSYLSLAVVQQLFSAHGLTIFHVETLDTHGGSLRIHAERTDSKPFPISPTVSELLDCERDARLNDINTYRGFGTKASRIRSELIDFLRDARDQGQSVIGYGAPAKATTFLNYCGISTDILPFTVDRNHYKQGKFIPRAGIPVRAPQELIDARPCYVLILPWNLKDEVIEQLTCIREWGGRFLVAIPTLEVLR